MDSLKNSEKLEIKIDKTKPTNDLKKAVQYQLTEKEQLELINELLKVLPEPPEIVQKFATYYSNLKKEGGYWNATVNETWLLAKQDFKKEKKIKEVKNAR